MRLSAPAAALLDALWRDFTAHAPQAARIRDLLAGRGEHVHHDHLVLRAVGAPAGAPGRAPLGLDAIGARFEALGWVPRERYQLAAAHLRGRTWQHPDPDAPKVVVSELDPAGLPPRPRALLEELLAEAPPDFAARPDLPCAGRPWTPTAAAYRALAAASEPAARLAALGLGVDHFTLDASALLTFPDLDALVAFLGEHGFRVDARRGHAAVRPDSIAVRLADEAILVPSGRYALVEWRRGAPAARHAPAAPAPPAAPPK